MPTLEAVWPHEYKTAAKGKWQFEPVVATIKRAFTGKGSAGYIFEEDTNQTDEGKAQIWNMAQEWNQDERAFDPYEGPTFSKGQIVKVWLSYEKFIRKDGSDGVAYKIAKIVQSTEQPATAATLPVMPTDLPHADTARPQTAHAEPQDMSDAEAALKLRLNADMAAWLKVNPRPQWEFTNQANIAAKAIERESIERQTVLKADAEIIAASYGSESQLLSSRHIERYNRLAELLAHLPAAEPMPTEATTPPTDAESLPWGDEEKKKP